MMNEFTMKEYDKLKSDRLLSETSLNSSKNKFADEIKNGLGERIHEEINKPVVPIKKSKIKIFFEKLLKACQ